MKPYKILYAHHDGSISGSGKSLRNFLACLNREQFEPRVLLANEGPARELFEPLDIKVDMIPTYVFGTFPGPHPYKLSWLMNWRAFLPNIELSNYLKRMDWDLLHINDKAMLSVGLEARDLNKPIVWHSRSTYYPTYSKLNTWASRKTIRSIANRIIAISEDEVDGFEDLNHLQIIYNSVNFSEVEDAILFRSQTRSELGLSDGDILIGQVSNTLGEVRGTWDFLNACGEIKKIIPDQKLHFLIVAKIPEPPSRRVTSRIDHNLLEKTQLLAKINGISEQLTLTGFRKDVLRLMAAMDVIVVCNHHGVLGRMPFEAMAVGCPLVVTAGHSGRSRVVIDRQTAVVVPPADPKAIANGVVEILLKPSFAKQLSNQGIQYAHEHFDSQKNVKQVEQTYLELLSK